MSKIDKSKMTKDQLASEFSKLLEGCDPDTAMVAALSAYVSVLRAATTRHRLLESAKHFRSLADTFEKIAKNGDH